MLDRGTGARWPLATLILGLAVAGCRAKSAPEYHQAESDYSILLMRLGDDAYSDPQLESVIARLRAIPSNALEASRASELLAKIELETKRIAAEKAEKAAEGERARVAAVALTNAIPSRSQAPRPPSSGPASPQVNDGPGMPPVAAPRPVPSLPTYSGWRVGAAGYQSAVAEQRMAGCPVLVYFSVEWCGYCKQFDAKVLTDRKVEAEIATAIKVRVDPDRLEADKQLTRRLGVKGYPTILLIPGEGEKPVDLSTGVGRGMQPKPEVFSDDYHERVAYAWGRAAYEAVGAGRQEEAIAKADRLIAFDPHAQDGYGYAIRAQAFRHKGDMPAAVRDYVLACAAGCEPCCATIRRR